MLNFVIRIRRVKCDEAKPSCQRCLNTGRKCDGYLPKESKVTRRQLDVAIQEFSDLGSVSQALSHFPQQSRSPTPESFALFDVFRHLTAPSTTSFMPSQFWTRELLQLAHCEPAFWHATLALGALHQQRQIESVESIGSYRAHALTRETDENHARAMSHAQKIKDPAKLLALSLALVSISSMTGRWAESQVHIAAAHRLLSQTKNDPATKPAAEMLLRLDLQAMTFSESTAPYPFADAAWLTQVDEDMRQRERLESYEQAGTAIYAICRRLLLFDAVLATNNVTDEKAAVMMQDLMLDLTTWEYQMSLFEREHSGGEPCAASIRLYHTIARLLVKTTLFGPETRWDNMLGYFERVLGYAEYLVFQTPKSTLHNTVSLEPGLVIPLFLTATRCRHPQLRRQAIAYMWILKRLEGMWASEAAAAAAEKVLAVEEGDLYQGNPSRYATETPSIHSFVDQIPWEAWSKEDIEPPARSTWNGIKRIPEAKRVREMLVMVDKKHRHINLTFIMCSGDEEGTFGEVRSDFVTF